ncbi:MAG: tRNA 5-methoxyuridine(34)/uridine 5-oxyacetic acid(34) synthase CmoB [Alteromonadaceae bacterium]|nr:MAG: tRNA 5-methoxyuridine(34)/uridine 5-oxyacetic acid(34) synthase CmoB [Alteromonadaceae bacterium]
MINYRPFLHALTQAPSTTNATTNTTNAAPNEKPTRKAKANKLKSEALILQKFTAWAEQLPEQIAQGLCTQRFGDLGDWLKALQSLPDVCPSSMDFLDEARIGMREDLNDEESQQVDQALKALIPWRKGPYSVFGTHIDTEWRSDWKWDRLREHIAPLAGKTILDVGCGNGYHCWRMLGEQAARVIGIDPSPRFVVQFYMMKHFAQAYWRQQQPELGNGLESERELPVDILPIGIEALPAELAAFDTTFSMGVLYHRRSPMDHLRELKATLKPGGQLVLETLIIPGKLGDTLVPEGRYAKMNNVWFIPSAETLISWLSKCGFTKPRCVDSEQTSLEEQRSTDWMTFQSLQDFLSPDDINLTIEGHPAPMRGVFVAEAPSQ